MEWKFDKYDEGYATLVSSNGNITFVVRQHYKKPEIYEVFLYCNALHQYIEIKLCCSNSKEEAMSFVENLIKEIKDVK